MVLLASAALVGTLWWLGRGIASGDAIGAGFPVHELEFRAPDWSSLLDPLRTQALQLAAVDFAGLEALAAEPLMAALDLQPIALIDVDPDGACRRLLAAEPRVASCAAVRIPPGRLVMYLRERHPIAVVAATLEGVDATGSAFALQASEASTLPAISGDVAAAVAALVEARRDGLALRAVRAERADDVVLELASPDTTLRIGYDVRRGMQGWRALLEAVPAAELAGAEVDARFRGQVLLRAASAADTREGADL